MKKPGEIFEYERHNIYNLPMSKCAIMLNNNNNNECMNHNNKINEHAHTYMHGCCCCIGSFIYVCRHAINMNKSIVYIWPPQTGTISMWNAQ